MDKIANAHIEEIASDTGDINKAVAAGLHVERKLLDGNNIILIPTPSDDPKGRLSSLKRLHNH